jgi:hypothetical protein
VDRQSSSAWLSDFAVHVAIKPLVKGIEWVAFPALLMAGVVDEATVGLAILAGGSVSRTLYTAGRVLHDLLRGRRAPWVALGVGTLPVIGNLAFPAQIAWRSREEADLAAQFLLYADLGRPRHPARVPREPSSRSVRTHGTTAAAFPLKSGGRRAHHGPRTRNHWRSP